MQVRPATIEDAPAIALAHIRSWQAAYRGLLPDEMLDGLDAHLERRTERWAEIIDAGTPSVLVALTNSTIVGFSSVARCRDDDHGLLHRFGEVQAIYLRKEAWGVGLGRTLMERSEALLGTLGFTDGCVWVLESNARARRFYEAAGWRADGVEKAETMQGQTLHEVRYAKSLTGSPPIRSASRLLKDGRARSFEQASSSDKDAEPRHYRE